MTSPKVATSDTFLGKGPCLLSEINLFAHFNLSKLIWISSPLRAIAFKNFSLSLTKVTTAGLM